MTSSTPDKMRPTEFVEFYRSVHAQTPLLTSTNYAFWQIGIEHILKAENLWELVEEKEEALPVPLDEVQDLSNRRAKAAAHIWSSLSARAQSLLNEKRNPANMWTEIPRRFSDANTATSRINLRMKLFDENKGRRDDYRLHFTLD